MSILIYVYKIKISVLYMFLKSYYHNILNTVKDKAQKKRSICSGNTLSKST